MEAYIRPPQPLSGVGDMAQNWQRWKKDFLIFLKASNNAKKSKDLKAYLLRSHIGQVGQDVIDKIIPNNSTDKDDINTLLAMLDRHFNPPKNELIERYNFFKRSRKSNESIEDYINDLKNKAATCNFGNMKNSLIRDKVIVDLKDKNLRTKLFETQDLDLLTLITMFKEHETIMQQKSQTCENTAEVKKNTTNSTHIQNIDNANNNNDTKLSEQSKHLKNIESRRQCWRCKQQHAIRSCPAWGFKCEKCGERNHYTYCCQNGNNNHRRGTNTYKTNTNTPSNPNMNLPRENLQYHPGGPSGSSALSAPSAPQLPEANNVLYPNLSYMTDAKNTPNSNAWSWVEQRNMKANNNFQTTEAPQNTNAPQRPHVTRITPTAKVTADKEKDQCKIS